MLQKIILKTPNALRRMALKDVIAVRYNMVAPPMRYIPLWKEVAAFLGIYCFMLSYPTYVFFHFYDYCDKPVKNPLNEESMQILEDHKRRREAGEFAILQYEIGKKYDIKYEY